MGLSSDFISGFCGESEEEHRENLSLLSTVGFDQAFTYSYSKREQTYAGLFMTDDIPENVKGRRLQEMVETFQRLALKRNTEEEVGRLHVVLVEGLGKPSSSGSPMWTGRTDTNKRVLFSATAQVLSEFSAIDAAAFASLPVTDLLGGRFDDPMLVKEAANQAIATLEKDVLDLIISKNLSLRKHGSQLNNKSLGEAIVDKGKYVIVKIAACRGHTLRAVPLAVTSLSHAHEALTAMRSL